MSDEVLKELNDWSIRAKINPKRDFDCPHFHRCKASVQGALNKGDTCAMSYVGRRYGEYPDFKLVIPGMDHGTCESITYENCRAGIEKSYQAEQNKFNPHYIGVVKTAALFLGQIARDCEIKCVQEGKCYQLSSCVLNSIVQPNLVKCVPNSATNMTSKTTEVMRQNCAHHLIDELSILKPDLIVFHGSKSRGVIKALLGNRLIAVGDVCDKYGDILYRFERSHILFLHHPSRGWLKKQWESIVLPIAKILRQRQIIPE